MKSKPKQIVVSVCVCVKISQNPVLHTQRVLVIASVAVHCVTALNADSTEEKKKHLKDYTDYFYHPSPTRCD